MKFECGDLERAFEHAQLMPEAREHLKHCAACRKEYRLWNEISSTARELHEEWDTPALWPAIRDVLGKLPNPQGRRPWWAAQRTWMLTAAAVVLASTVGVFSVAPWQQHPPQEGQEPAAVRPLASSGNRDLLTEQALAEVERTESAYRQSIDKLSHLAQSELLKPRSTAGVNCKEKLKLLDDAIAETRANLEQNRYNMRLQTALADLYREKKQALQELLTSDQKN
ncbi:MAG: hypothetical protein JOY54_21555 [Acidobacteriaceae bacterium]|nr:hypothetical protein [Acidobacteriaceae bacterium]